ncbi:MAG: hypothetical protein IPG28_11345 [Betaproteobacteria bacterium]|nr:hypothetical protein [Betaproteobacteria bacterium]
MALVLLAVAMLTAISLPRFGGAVAIVALVAAGATALRRDAWLIILPLLLPLFDLTHWTGRFFWTEFDVVCAATLAMLWWRYGLDAGTRWTRLPAGLTLLALGIWTLAGAVASGWPFPAPMRANLDSYFSPLVGFYSAKGIGWALLFYPFAALAMAENEGARGNCSLPAWRVASPHPVRSSCGSGTPSQGCSISHTNTESRGHSQRCTSEAHT